MIRNKKLLYYLLPATIAIWGIVFYKVLTTLWRGDDAAPAIPSANVKGAKEKISADTFSLIGTYRDPFLGKIADKPPISAEIKPPVHQPVKTEVKTVWPAIIYGGMIKNQQTKKMVALININGQDNLLAPGEEKEGLKLLAVFPDSVEMISGKEKRVIRKKK
ncbi:MAG: hypothetical protein HYY40_11860 [Bacteroidetes bacterium]|nr:hypothetical protein [Bacteroidota bacterium]